MNILEYANGWGHLFMSIALLICAMMLILFPGTTSDLHAIGITTLLTVTGAWFIPGAAKQAITQVKEALPPPPPTEAPKP